MSSTRALSTHTAKPSRRYFSKAVLSMASLTLAAGGLATLGAPAQAAATPTTQVQSAAVETEPSRLLCRLHTGCAAGWGAVI